MHIAVPRNSPVKKRSQVKTKLGGAGASAKRNKKSGEFMAVKKPAKKTSKEVQGRAA
jgi:hypothetical protein